MTVRSLPARLGAWQRTWMDFTEEELAALASARTQAEWDSIFGRVTAARDGAYPTDWYERIVQSGLQEERAKAWQVDVPDLTDEEFAALEAANTRTEWDSVCSRVKRTRGDRFPNDWYDRVIESGLSMRQVTRFG